MNEAVNKKEEFWKKLMLLLTSTLVIMADLTVSPILPKIQAAFPDVENINLLVKMVLTTPAVFIVASSAFIGHLLDKYGRKNIILISIFIYIISGTSGFYADSIYELLIGRAFLGVSTAGVINGCSALIGDYYKGEDVNKMMGLQSSFIGYSGLLYLVLSGFLADIHWRATFLIYLLPLALFFAFTKYIKEPHIKGKLTKNANLADIKDTKFLKKIFLLSVIAFVLMVFFYMLPLQLPFYLKSIMTISNSQIGMTIATMTLFSATTAAFYSKIKSKLSFRTIFVISFLSMGIGYIAITAVPEYFYTAVGMAFTGVGMGLVITNIRTWVGTSADSAFLGRAFGILTTSFYLGQFFSPIIINEVIKVSSLAKSFTIAGFFMISVSLFFVFIPVYPANKIKT